MLVETNGILFNSGITYVISGVFLVVSPLIANILEIVWVNYTKKLNSHFEDY